MSQEIAIPHVLVVDDDVSTLAVLVDVLRAEQFEVSGEANAPAALDWLRRNECAVLVSDQKMPGMTGLELFEHARSWCPDTVRILLTSVMDVNLVLEAVNSGSIYRFLIKPWLHDELVGAVRAGQERFALVRQNMRLQAATNQANEQLMAANRDLRQQLERERARSRRLEQIHRQLESQVRQLQSRTVSHRGVYDVNGLCVPYFDETTG